MANVDLRPMTLGEVLDRTFTLYREHFPLFAGITALPYLATLVFKFGFLLLEQGKMLEAGPNLQPSVMGGVLLGALGSLLLLCLVIGVAQSATVAAVSDLYLGRPTSVADAYGQAKGSIATVLAVMVMVYFATVVGAIFLIVPGVYLACRLAVSVPAAIVEKNSPVASMERSMGLTKGFAGQMFLLLLLVGFIGWAFAMLLQAPVMFYAFTSMMAKHQVPLGVSIYSYLAEYVSQVVVGPIGTISAALMYYNLRVRKEGFDIQHLMNSLGSVPRPLADAPSVQSPSLQ
jgi:hypothetical protein